MPRSWLAADMLEAIAAKAGRGGGGGGLRQGGDVVGVVLCAWCDDDEKKPATIHCPTCGDSLCEKDAQKHARAGGTRTHAVLTMEEHAKEGAGGGKGERRFVFFVSFVQ